jgi:hypothetical protein
MRFAVLAVLLLAPRNDPFQTLADPAKRADESARKAALADFRVAAKDSAAAWVAAKFLERSEADWKLARTPAGADLDAFLAKYWSKAPGDDVHKDALAAALAAAEKHAKSSPGPEVFQLFALAHLSALGDRAAESAGKLGLAKEDGRWGTRDQLALQAIAKGFAKPAYIPAQAEAAARSSAAFGPRYVVALLDLQKVLFANTGFAALYKSLPTVGGTYAPKAAAEHLKALAEGLKAAVSCAQCKDGKITCDTCQGRKKADVTCPICKGLGWMQKGDKANVLIPCSNCKGALVFRNSNCPGCKQQGTLDCVVCLGKGWRENFKGCRNCTRCGTCLGKRIAQTPCATCGGKGRVPPIVAGIPSILCGDCKGQAILKEPCKACAETGLADCGKCGGKGPRDGKSPARPQIGDIYQTAACAPCASKGWPLPNLAVPCESCYGLGIQIRPSLDPTRTLY